MDPQSVSVVLAYTLAIIYSIISLILVYIEIKRSWWSKNSTKEDKGLNILSNLSMILFQICMILAVLHKTPYICTKTYWMGTIVWISANCALTMFQTRRLQYTFLTQFKNTPVESYGYPNGLFCVLYIFGTLLFAVCCVFFPKYAYGHLDHGSDGCQITFQSEFFWMAGSLLSLLFVWDWIVLGLYMYRVHQLRKVIKTGLNDDNVLKASYIVRKILFLTIFFEITTLTNVLLFSRSDHPSVSTAMHLSDTMMSMIIVFLMRQHNDDWYRKCICCCLSKVLLIEKTKHLVEYHSVLPAELDEERAYKEVVCEAKNEVITQNSVEDDQIANNNTRYPNKHSSCNKSSRAKVKSTLLSITTKTNTAAEYTKTSRDITMETMTFEHPPFNDCDTYDGLGLSERN